MSDTPLEKAARAAMMAGFPAERMSMVEAEEVARAVLMAVREPDAQTQQVGWITFRNSSWHELSPTEIDVSVGLGAFRELQTAMIDHILRGGETS